MKIRGTIWFPPVTVPGTFPGPGLPLMERKRATDLQGGGRNTKTLSVGQVFGDIARVFLLHEGSFPTSFHLSFSSSGEARTPHPYLPSSLRTSGNPVQLESSAPVGPSQAQVPQESPCISLSDFRILNTRTYTHTCVPRDTTTAWALCLTHFGLS